MVMKVAKPAKRRTRTEHGKHKGRPITTEYDPELIRALAAVGCTVYEIANQCGFSEQNFHDLKKKYPEIQEAIDQGKSELHKSLRKKQIDIAMEGNVAMLIHLGKTQLGQSEKLTLAGDKENPLAVIRLRWGDEVEAAEEENNAGRNSSGSDSSSS
jgi:cytidylate kinase